MLRLRRELLTIVAAIALIAALPLGLRGQTAETLQASYDDKDQLIKVVDPSGNVTTYTYDAIGNMVSITTSIIGGGGTGLAIFNFTPQQGGVGTTVTIQGQNFSTTPSADVVKFNGTAATVGTATSSTLTVTVPSGATTGPISVTVGSSTATTTTNFTILQNPEISSVNPTSALQGGTVSAFQVTGLNLTGATFSFVPAFVPPAITPSNVSISPDGTSATMTLTLSSTAVGSFGLVATTGAGSSSQISGSNNTVTVLSTNPSADADGDGLTNLYETAISSNPLNPSTTNDGIPDGWALFFGLNPTDPTGGSKIAPDGLTYLQAFQRGLNPLVPTLVPPTVSNVFPADGTTNYPTNGVVVVRFSEPLQAPVSLPAVQTAINIGLPSGSNFPPADAVFAAQVLQSYLLRTCCGGTAAVPGAVQLFQGSLAVGGTVILSSDGLSLVFAPSQPLSSSTTYTVVAQGVRAASGIQMTQVFQSSFTTGLTSNSGTGNAILTSPPSGTTGVPTNSAFMVQFSKQVDPATVTPQTFYLTDSVTGKTAPGTLQVDPSGFTASFVPSALYSAGRTYYVQLTSGILDITQNPFAGAFYTFTTGFAPQSQGPQLLGLSPVNGATGSPLNSVIVAQFNEPISIISATTGLQLQQGGTPLAGAIALSNGNTLLTFTPLAPLSASTVYTIAVTSQITDVAENALTNPGNFTFTTGTTSDTTTPSVTLVDPPSNSSGVGLNVAPRLTFSEPVDHLTVPSAFTLQYGDASGPALVIAATVTVSADQLHATLTPSASLSPSSYYYLYICGYTSLAGKQGSCFESTFYTGNSSVTNSVTVTTINPGNAQTGVPLNAQVAALMSNNIDPTSITNNSITVTPSGGSAISGTVALASDGVTLTFAPAGALTASTVYNVSVSGFTDIDGNAVTPFASTFTTGSATYGNGSFTVFSMSPANGSTGVSVTSPVTLTMTNLINAASVNPNTVFVYVYSTNQVVAGSYSVSGASVTFTPLTPYPGNTQMAFGVYGLTDEAGNPDYQYGYTFTTANTVDHTAPTVTISPANGTTNVGLNTQIVLTFSKSINPTTITANTLALFNGDTALAYNYSVSRDNRTVVMNYNNGTLPAGATITIELTSGIQDLSGNSLANTTSQFTLTTQLSGYAPQVVQMRPGNGATNVPASTVVTLFTNAAMNPSTVPGALHVTDNGVVVSGSVQLFSNAQAIEFTPSAAFNTGDLIQVFLDPTAQSADGVALSSFSGQFTIAGSPTNTAATVQAVNPFPSATNVPLNTVIQVEYNQALQASTLSNASVTLYQYSTGTYLTPTVSLVGTQVINIAPTSNLVSGSGYQVYISPNNGVTNTSGVPVQPYAYNFTAGTTTDTVAPTIVSQAPTNNATNIGTNAFVSVNFNKAINPISVTGSTIALKKGATTELPSSISFSPDYTRVSIIPQAPMPASTQMTVAISAVTSEAGVSVASKTTHFTTAAQPDFTAPYVVSSSVQSGQTNVPVNSVFTLQFSKPMDIGTFNAQNVSLYNYNTGQYVTSTVSWSADQTTIFLVPNSPLSVGDQYALQSYYMTDLSGNPQQNFSISFFVSFNANTNPPTVINTSPENTETAVPVNAPVQILFSEPIQPTSVGQITLTTGGNPVAVTPSFSDANQLLTLTPTLPLLASSTTYTITITGVLDTAGNKMTGTVTNTFQTGPTFNLLHPSVTVTDPPNGATGVGINVAPRIVFSERLNPLSVVSSSNELYNRGSVELYTYDSGQYIPATVSMSADRLTATITPTSALLPNTQYYLFVGYGQSFYDVAGNYGNATQMSFVTGSGSDTSTASVSSINPANTQTGVPLNAQITVVMNDDIDPTTVSNSSITVTPSGGSAITGTVTLASDGVTLTFVPAGALTASTVYNVSVGGFKDVEGNSVTTFTSSFTTGSTSYGAGSFTVVSTSPTNGSTGVSVTSPVTFTMTNLINAASVNPNTVFVYVYSTNQVVAGSYSVSGTSVTFTPLNPYPANTQMGMGVYGLTDEAGNPDYQYGYTFTTTNTVDHTAPTVTISPANGTTNVGLNTQIVLTFSKSINPATINAGSVNLLNGDLPINPATSVSRDNRTVVMNYNNATLPAGATLTATATSLITDLSGNALANTTSQFTTTAAVSNAAPSVISMRPGNGATQVPTSTVITLFTTTPMNSGTLSGALHISQGGVLVSGTTTVGSNGQSIEFTPSSALSAGTTIQVFLDSTAQDIYGNNLSSFSGQFTTAGSPTNTAAVVQAVNPFPSALNVPLNAAIQIEYNQPLLASTINNTNVVLYQYSTSTFLTPTLSLSGGGQIINITPTSNLVAGSQYFAYVSYGGPVTNIDGINVQAYELVFTAGTTTDTVAPTVVTVTPPNLATKIGTNAGVAVAFNKAINPVSVTGSSIQLSGGSVTEVPSSISFTTDYKRTVIIPQAPLPSSTQMAIAISGVTGQNGVAVASQTTHFTTMAGADFFGPSVIDTSVESGLTVGTNAVFAMQFNEPIDPSSVNPGGATTDVFLYDYTTGYVATTTSFSADMTTIFLTPTANLTPSQEFEICSYYVTDLSGNPQQNFCVSFFSGTGTDTTGPVVQQVSPPSGFTGVGINAPVDIMFSEAIDGASLGGVTLKQGSSVIPTTTTLYDGDRGVQLQPLVPLAPSMTYTINVTGVLDITGNAQSSFPSQSFTTGTGTDLVTPTVVSTFPTSGQANVPDNSTLQAVFSQAMDPATFDANNSFTLRDASNNVVPATITFSSDFKTVSLKPNSNLTGGGATYYFEISYQAALFDVGGNQLNYGYIQFTTQ
jgi:YD repeat-containing protein